MGRVGDRRVVHQTRMAAAVEIMLVDKPLICEHFGGRASGYSRGIALSIVRYATKFEKAKRKTYLVSVSEPRCVTFLPTMQYDPFVTRSTITLPSFVVSQCSSASRSWEGCAHDSDAVAEVFVVYCPYQRMFLGQR